LINLRTRIPRDSSKAVTRFINKVIDRMMDILYGKQQNINGVANGQRIGGIVNGIYNNMISSEKFKAIIKVCALLMVVIYGIAILMGLAQFNSADLIKTFIKFGIIYMLLRPESWKFFNDNFFNLFINGPKQLIQFVTTPPDKVVGQNSETYILGPISDVIQRFTDFAIWKQLFSILFAGPMGWILFFFLLQSCWFFICGSLSAILTYIVSIVIVGVFISIAPIFILCLMFKKTIGIFNAWVKVLMVNTLNAVFVFAALTLVSGVVSVLINQIFGFGVCTDCILTYHGSLENFNFCILYGDMPDNFGGHLSYEERIDANASIQSYPEAQSQFFGFPFPFFAFVCFVIMSHVVSNLSVFFALMAEDLVGVDYGSPTQAANIPSKVAETMQSWVGTDKESKQQEAYKKSKGGGKKEIAIKDTDTKKR
jgi:type IV secretion system protein VirB6